MDPRPDIPAQYLLSRQAPKPRTLIDMLYATAERHPDSPAIDDGEVQLTYAELISDIEESVEWLAARGIGRGDRIGIRMPSGSYALYVAILSTLAAGAAYVPVDADDPDERAELVFGEAGVVGDHHRSAAWSAATARPAAGVRDARSAATTRGSSSPPGPPEPRRVSR